MSGMHYHDAAIEHKKTVETDVYLQQFFHKLFLDAQESYAHTAHAMNPAESALKYKVDKRCEMWDYEAANMMEVDWRWRYYFFLDAINNLLK